MCSLDPFVNDAIFQKPLCKKIKKDKVLNSFQKHYIGFKPRQSFADFDIGVVVVLQCRCTLGQLPEVEGARRGGEAAGVAAPLRRAPADRARSALRVLVDRPSQGRPPPPTRAAHEGPAGR